MIEWKSCFKAGTSLFLLYLCINYWASVAKFVSLLLNAAMPLLFGCVIAYLVNILMRFYEKHYFVKTKGGLLLKGRRTACLLAAFITLFAVVFLVICLVAPQLASCIRLILAELPRLIEKSISLVREWGVLPENFTTALAKVDWRSRIEQIVQVLISGVSNVAGTLVSAVTAICSGVVTAMVAIIFSVYLLKDKDTLRWQFHKVARHYLNDRLHDKLIYVLGVLDDCFHKYIVGQCTEAVILGVLCTVGMWILRLPYATMIGALIGLTALIPVAGAYIGAGVGAFMILTVSPIQAVIFLVFIVVLQQLEGNLIYPKVVGSSMGLPAIWVLSGVTFGGGIMGIPGMLLGVPLVATIYRLIRNDVNQQSSMPEECEQVPNSQEQ